MLSIAAIKNTSADGSGGGMPAYLKSTEYYLDATGVEQSSSKWCGRGADALGLTGQTVTEELMDKLADGFAPDGTKLRQNAGRKPEFRPTLDRNGQQRLDEQGQPMGVWVGERVGFDCTFSAPKSFSIAFAAADPALRDRMLDTHHKAVETGLRMMELHAAETRRGHGSKDVIEVDGLLVSRHTHYAAREHDKVDGTPGTGIDMQVHTHALVYNVCLGKDGKWATLEPREMYAWKMAVGAIYRAELAKGLQALGFGIEDDIRLDENGQVKDRFFKVSGVPDELVRERSGRRKQIEAFMEANPEASAQEATMATRAGKDEPSFGELVNSIWKDELNDWRARNPGQFPQDMRELLNRPLTPEQQQEQERQAQRTQQEQDKEILDELHETQSVWSRKDLTRAIAERSAGKRDAAGIIHEVSQFLGRNDLALILPEAIHKDDRGEKLARRHRAVRFADPKVVAQEQTLVREALARKDEQTIRLDPESVKVAVAEMEKERGFQLNAEQLKSVDFVCLESGGVAVVEGRAGTGKTTSADAIVKAFQASGFEVIGAATGWDAAKKLESESAGAITGHSIASLNAKLDKGKMQLNDKTLLIVDEAGMVGTPSLTKLMSHAHAAGAKVLLQGDKLQLQSVERGGPLRLLAKELGSVDLRDIRRQRHQADRDTAHEFYAAGDDTLRSRGQNLAAGTAILQRMEQRGQLQGYADRDQAKKYLVQDYMQSPLPAREKLIIAGPRADVAELNHLVRQAHRDRGELGPDVAVDVRHPRTDVKETVALAVGDRVRFGKKDEDLGLVNGTRAVVTGLTKQKDGHVHIEATIESDIKTQDGRKLSFSTADYAYLEHGYAGTVHKSQGQGKEQVFHCFHRGMTDRQLSLVAFTRAKDSYAMYGGPEIHDIGIDASFATDRLQTNALTEGLHGKTTQEVIRERAAALEAQTRADSEAKRQARNEPHAMREQPTPERPTAEQTAERQPDPRTVRAAEAFRGIRERLVAKAQEREREQSRAAARERKRTRERSEGGLSR
ncbi:hypothetical protein ASG87_01545 [Frateuria sp. Soil773]|uniref:MobF family relaxase n=1 Tax=Frateuria sp. Soil773 TaxID=1736407 RepID=UPI0006F2C284|nr:MobF family relaxase [Frateuria sp. Soil773]KRE90848.1 hypothetical protein ASG87_01545 [Frateuria sp. Soil773]